VCVCVCVSSLIVARQRLGKNPLMVGSQRLGRNVTVVTNTHVTIEELLDASFSMWPVSYQGKYAISSSQNFLSVQKWSETELVLGFRGFIYRSFYDAQMNNRKGFGRKRSWLIQSAIPTFP
jgi:hypothetical protein